MAELLKVLSERFNMGLRLVASGLVTLVIIGLADTDGNTGLRCVLLDSGRLWLVLASAALMGIMTYAVYMAVFEDLFMYALHFSRALKCGAGDAPKEYFERELSCIRHVQLLYRERAARYADDTPGDVKAFQQRLDTGYAWLVFLYCTGLQLLVACIWSCWHLAQSGSITRWTAAAAACCLGCGLVADRALTLHEIWLVVHEPRWAKGAIAPRAVIRREST